MAQVNGINGESHKIPLGLYLWKRIKQLGISTVMGVPGDFNLELLDYVYQVDGLDMVCNANELNAAYAADGYARTKGVPGVFVTTHGVGELSALNGVMGSLCERQRVIHVVGQTSRVLQDNHMMIHHSVGTDVDHQMYSRVSKLARLDAAELWDPESAPAEIDRVLRKCIVESGPVYIFMPLDLCMENVPDARLHEPIDTSPSLNTSSQHFAVEAIRNALFSAKNPILFVDGNAKAYHVRSTVQSIARKLRIPTYHGTMGKSVVNETEEYYAGMYQGGISDTYLQEHFESADCVLNIGPVDCDTNSGGFTRKFPPNTIRIDPFEVTMSGQTFSNLHISGVLSELDSTFSKDETRVSRTAVPTAPIAKPPVDASSLKITQSWLWDKLAAQLQPHDVVFAETGTAVFGLCYQRMPKDITFLTQTYYGSIGWATPAALGVELALRELANEKGVPRGRTVLLTGDGSLNLTIQEIATMITNNLRPLIIILNNAGYTIERVIHGARQPYNDINPVNYKALLAAFNHPDPENHYFRAETKEEFERLFREHGERLRDPRVTTVVEIMADALDSPWRLTKQISIRGPAYKQYLIDEGFIGEGRVGIGG